MASSALIDDLLKQFAENPRRVFARLANEYRKRGELDTAIEICRAHVPLQPTYISGYIVLGQALYETGQLDEAQSTFETALGLDPENLIGLRQLGDIARAKGDADGARGWYRRLLEVDPQNDEVEALLRELDAPAKNAPAAAPEAAPDVISWNDINPENTKTAEPAPSAAPAPAPEPTTKALDFDYNVLSSFGEAEALPAFEQPEPAEATRADAPTIDEAIPETPAPVAPAAPAAVSRPVVEESSSHDEPLPAAFITETMAELYLQQGHREQALDIYRLLLAQRPGDVSLLNRIARLEQPAPAAPVERTVRAFFGRFANRRPPGVRTETDLTPVAAPAVSEPVAAEEPAPLGEPVAPTHTPASDEVHEEPAAQAPSQPESNAPVADEPSIAEFAPAEAESAPEPVAAAEPEPIVASPEPEPAREREFAADRVISFAELFSGRGTSPADEQAATTLASAFGSDAGVPNGAGHPTRAADDALSLDDVFGGGAHEHESAAVTFDEFFAPRDAGAQPDAAAEGGAESHAAPSPSVRRADDADLELFHQWLEGLKK
ncbi:MAG TPA: tetratricopeptide repeat protein [Gemmatimonadaceae bacterium]